MIFTSTLPAIGFYAIDHVFECSDQLSRSRIRVEQEDGSGTDATLFVRDLTNLVAG